MYLFLVPMRKQCWEISESRMEECGPVIVFSSIFTAASSCGRYFTKATQRQLRSPEGAGFGGAKVQCPAFNIAEGQP